MLFRSGDTIVNMLTLDLMVGSGGVLSHAPRRHQTMMMMIDAFLPEGVTKIAVDSIFMMPHLGVLASINEEIATEVFNKDCMVYIGSCVAPVGKIKEGKIALEARIELPDGTVFEEKIPFGELRLIPCPAGSFGKATLKPGRGLDLGAGKNQEITANLIGGGVGIVLDTRGRRPFVIPVEAAERVPRLIKWMKELKAYPQELLN